MSQLTTFSVDSSLFGIDITRVQEIIRPQEMTPVPLARGDIEGLINLRGQIVTAMDLRRRLGLPERPQEMSPMNVVVRSDHGLLSLLVDDIGDVLEVDGVAFAGPPETLRGEIRDLVARTYMLESELLIELDLDRVVNPSTQAGQKTP